MKLKFIVVSSPLKGQVSETDADVVRIGRAPENDLVLQQRSVSRLHAQIVARNGALMIEDFGSSNQTKVDGEPVKGSAPIGDGSIVVLGDVAVEVRCPELVKVVEAAYDAEETPAQAVLVPTERSEAVRAGEPSADVAPAIPEGWLAAVQEAGPPMAVDRGARLERKIWPIVTFVLSTFAVLTLVLFFLKRAGDLDASKGEFGVYLRVNSKKVVQVPRGFVHNPVVAFPGTVKVTRPMNLDLAVQIEGLKQGLATVTLYSEAGEHILLHVNVLPLEQQQAAGELADQVRSDQDRIELATESMKRGEVLEEQRALYEAMEQYGRALAVLAPFERNPNRSYTEALDRYDRLAQEIQERYDTLTRDMANHIKTGNKLTALECLGEIKDLIPDEGDVRRQNADLLFRLLESAIEAEKHRARRGL